MLLTTSLSSSFHRQLREVKSLLDKTGKQITGTKYNEASWGVCELQSLAPLNADWGDIQVAVNYITAK